MSKSETILVVVDPTADAQPALERGLGLARRLGMRVELFIADYQAHLIGATLLSSKRTKLARQQLIRQHVERLDTLAAAHRDIDISTKAAWDHPLHESVIREALKIDARYVVKDTHYHSAILRTLFTNTDWHLIRSCPVPLWLVKQDRAFEAPSILAAVDPMHEHDETADLDTRLLTEAFELSDALGGSVDVFHAFNPFESPEVMDQIEAAHGAALRGLADRLQVDPERVHLHAGITTDLLPRVVTDLRADLVVMGAVSRSRLERAVVGSTAENVLDRLACDILVVKPKGFESEVIFKSRPDDYFCAEGPGGKR